MVRPEGAPLKCVDWVVGSLCGSNTSQRRRRERRDGGPAGWKRVRGAEHWRGELTAMEHSWGATWPDCHHGGTGIVLARSSHHHDSMRTRRGPTTKICMEADGVEEVGDLLLRLTLE